VVDESRGVVGIDDENPHDGLVVLHLHFQLVHVRVPLVVRVHPVRVGRERGVQNLGQEVGRIGRLRENDPGIHADRAVAARNRIAQPVEEQDIVGGDLGLASPVDPVGQKLARLVHPLRGGVAEGLVVPDDLDEDFLHPLRDLLALLHGVPDVLPGHFHAAGLETVRHADDVPDFIGKPVSPLGDVESHDAPLPAPVRAPLKKPPVTNSFRPAPSGNPASKQPISQGNDGIFRTFITNGRKFLLNFSAPAPRRRKEGRSP